MAPLTISFDSAIIERIYSHPPSVPLLNGFSMLDNHQSLNSMKPASSVESFLHFSLITSVNASWLNSFLVLTRQKEKTFPGKSSSISASLLLLPPPLCSGTHFTPTRLYYQDHHPNPAKPDAGMLGCIKAIFHLRRIYTQKRACFW
jgi:hypothetical protein